jgi:hypothetical protein
MAHWNSEGGKATVRVASSALDDGLGALAKSAPPRLAACAPVDLAAHEILSPGEAWSQAVGRVPQLAGKCRPLPVERVEMALLRVERMQEVAPWRAGCRVIARKMNLSGLAPAGIKGVLGGWSRATLDPVHLLRPLDAAGLSIAYPDFVQHYDCFWSPWADDLVIVDDDFSWMIEMSHEEIVTFLEVASADGPR